MADILSTGCNAVSPRQYVDRADVIGVAFVSAFDAPEQSLRFAVVCTDAATLRACPAGVVCGNGDEHSPIPGQLVFQLSSELEPPLVENAFVQATLGLHVLTRLVGAARCRLHSYCAPASPR